MPRGPGKKENYNLEYSRFDGLDMDDDASDAKKRIPEPAMPSADGMPEMSIPEMLRHCPPELQEAYRMLQISKETGDPKAQQRANELAMMAMEKGSPEVKQDFMNLLAKHEPAATDKLRQTLSAKEMAEHARDDVAARATAATNGQGLDGMSNRIDSLADQMKAGAEATRQQMEALQKQQEALEQLQSPEDFFKFMQDGGMTEADLQRCFAGDMGHMQACVDGMLNKAGGKEFADTAAAKNKECEAVLKGADEIHAALFGGGEAAATGTPATDDVKDETEEPAAKAAKPKPKAKPVEEEAKIPDYRLQYQKDENGRYISVELKCSLPGVSDMSMINLDLAEKHLRLSTVSPAPKYVVNAGPFPVLIEPGAARAKYSKKRQELSITVPAKAS